MVLGKDILLNDIHMMEDFAVIGRFASKWIAMVILKKWTETNCSSLSGYYPCCLIMFKGWMEIVNSIEDVGKILQGHWLWGS